MSQLSSSGGVSEMYAKSAKDLANAGADPQKRAKVIKEICDKLVQRAPDRDQFVAAFVDRFYFTNDYTRDSKLIRYVLGAILRQLQPTTGQEHLTLEHITPQSKIQAGIADESIGSIGNLILVSETVNQKLAAKTFHTKLDRKSVV